MFIASWSSCGSNRGSIMQMDRQCSEIRGIKVRDAGVTKNLYKIDSGLAPAPVGPAIVEESFQLIESAAAPVLRKIISGHNPPAPDSEEYQNLCGFLASLVMRVPSRLQWFDELLRRPVETAIRRLHVNGELLRAGAMSAEELVGMLDRGEVEIKINKNAQLGFMLHSTYPLRSILMARTWSVLRSRSDAGELVFGDSPVILTWTDRRPGVDSPGFGLQNTAVFVPVGPTCALLGLWDKVPRDLRLSAQQVAFWNSESISQASRFIFFRDTFSAMHCSGVIDDVATVLRRWSERTTPTS